MRTQFHSLIVCLPDGTHRVLEAEPGQNLMAILRANDLPIAAICGGCMSCATCHVFIDPSWSERLLPPEPSECELLASDPHFRPGESRLACQIPFIAELDGMTVAIAPET